MSLEQNKDLVRRFVEVVQNQHDLAALDELFSPHFVDYGGMTNPPNREGARALMGALIAALPTFPKAANSTKERTMSEQDNIQVIQASLAAFGRGDIDAALALVAEGVDWQSPATGTPNPLLSWSTLRRTRAEVGQFFADLTAYAELQDFDTFAITAQGDRTVLEGRNAGRARSTGRSYSHDWLMVFTIKDGLIVRHRHYYDTADVVATFAYDPAHHSRATGLASRHPRRDWGGEKRFLTLF